jgi:hypothetical protein
MITKQEVLDLFEYCDGNLIRKSNNKFMKGATASGYFRANINGKNHLVHRLIFLMHHGYLPLFIDHINGNKSDNRIENLREAAFFQNCQNRKIRPDNTVGYKGVYWHKASQKWGVQVGFKGKRKYLGLYANVELADLVATMAREKYHGKFACHY